MTAYSITLVCGTTNVRRSILASGPFQAICTFLRTAQLTDSLITEARAFRITTKPIGGRS